MFIHVHIHSIDASGHLHATESTRSKENRSLGLKFIQPLTKPMIFVLDRNQNTNILPFALIPAKELLPSGHSSAENYLYKRVNRHPGCCLLSSFHYTCSIENTSKMNKIPEPTSLPTRATRNEHNIDKLRRKSIFSASSGCNIT